ncbi:MAG: hypothetical protein R3E82_00340 [Pseudomonadales bacterium]
MPDHPERQPPANVFQRLLLSCIVAVLVFCAWSGVLETSADSRLESTLQRALVTAAIARGLNGVISVAQGTEIAIQPVGVGVTLTAGEILDPLNDLVERFSWLALVAAASLGTQLLLTEIFSEPVISGIFTVSALLALALIWSPGLSARHSWLLRTVVLVIFVRFLFTTVGLVTGWVDAWVLAERQQVAISGLTTAQEDIEALAAQGSTTPADPALPAPGIRERFESFLDSSRQLLDIEAQLQKLQTRVESSIDQLMDLIVLFLVQTLLLPLATLWLSLAAFRSLWQWASRSG